MEPLVLLRRVLAWRWTPCVAPVIGSVSLALLTLAVIPDEIGATTGSSGPLALHGKRDATSSTGAEESLDTPPSRGAIAPTRPAGAGTRHRAPVAGVPGLFGRPQELPVEPVDPAQQPPVPEPPPPGPAGTTFTLPEPVIPPPPAPPLEEPATLTPLAPAAPATPTPVVPPPPVQ